MFSIKLSNDTELSGSLNFRDKSITVKQTSKIAGAPPNAGGQIAIPLADVKKLVAFAKQVAGMFSGD